MEEIRKEIPRLPEWKYFVSNLGRVKNWKVRNRKWKILKFESNHYWHQRVKLYWEWWRDDVRHYQVHRLVYCVFNNLDYDFWLTWKISNSYWLILHKDNNPLNNRLDNLYIGTQKDNMQQCINDWRFVFLEPKYWEANNRYKPELHVSRKTSDEFGGTPTGTIPSQASQGWDEGVTTNSIPLEQWWSWHERPTSNES